MATDPALPPPFTSRISREQFRLTFDDDAAAYDASRPIAPPAVFDDLVELACLRPGARVLEIGPGTGQATRPLLQRGLRVKSIEIGANLAALAARRLTDFGDRVELVHADFERWDPAGERYDAVFSCNAFHWIDPAIRFAKVASILEPGGHLAVISTPWVIPTSADRFWWDVQEDYEAVGAEGIDPVAAHPDQIRDLAPLVTESSRFEEPITRRHLFSVDFNADTYVTNLATQSGIKALDPIARGELLARIRRRIENHGGAITAHLLAVLTVAQVR